MAVLRDLVINYLDVKAVGGARNRDGAAHLTLAAALGGSGFSAVC
jgi:hypothetical protein